MKCFLNGLEHTWFKLWAVCLLVSFYHLQIFLNDVTIIKKYRNIGPKKRDLGEAFSLFDLSTCGLKRGNKPKGVVFNHLQVFLDEV